MQHKPTSSRLFLPICIGIICCLFSANLQASNPSITLITCDPGNEMYSMFGHSAFHVVDTSFKIDRVYNYGMFDFNTPNFYGKFAQGKLEYLLGVQSMKGFMYQYEEENRGVYEQTVNLTDAEAVQIVRFLDHNYLPENRGYLYDFFYDNCATKLRDILEEQLDGKLIYPSVKTEPIPFREMVDMYAEKPQPWGDFGIDLILGLPMDKQADFRNQMFLPDFLSDNLSMIRIKHDGKTEPLLGEKTTLYRAKPTDLGDPFVTPLMVMGLICLLLIVYTFLGKSESLQNTFDVVFFFILALLGLFWIVMWVFTDHGAAEWNFNMLWCNPLFLILIFGGFFGKKGKLKSLAPYLMFLCAFMLVFFWFSPQSFHIATYPIIALMTARAWRRMIALARKEGPAFVPTAKA